MPPPLLSRRRRRTAAVGLASLPTRLQAAGAAGRLVCRRRRARAAAAVARLPLPQLMTVLLLRCTPGQDKKAGGRTAATFALAPLPRPSLALQLPQLETAPASTASRAADPANSSMPDGRGAGRGTACYRAAAR